jgi:hypothetical protein
VLKRFIHAPFFERVDCHLGAVLAIIRNKMALQICLYGTSMYHQGYPSTALILFYAQE